MSAVVVERSEDAAGIEDAALHEARHGLVGFDQQF